MTIPAGYIPKDSRKKILLLSDDFRMVSGVAVMSKEIVVRTAHKYNWVQVGAAINHPEHGKVVDVSGAVNQETGLTDSYARIYPWNGYGDQNLIRHLMMTEQPHAILHFTDPRFWMWLYQMEHEIRQVIPILFYHVWDDVPFPRYNQNFYRSCDWISCISKQTYNVVRNVWQKDPPQDWQIQYIPHGIDSNIFRKIETPEERAEVAVMRQKMFGEMDVDFVVFYNNRNIRRKMTGDVILAYQHFIHQLPQHKRDRCRLVMHTQPVDENGTDLPAVIRDVASDCHVIFSDQRIDARSLNMLYNIADVTINLASNEGFGIGTVESLMAETPILVNVTGGLQDQCGFVDDEGKFLSPDYHFNSEWGTNADQKYTKHGEWVVPIFPSQRGLIGSPATPYIFDDRCKWEDAGMGLLQIYQWSPEERARRGKLGREFCLGPAKFDARVMAQTFDEGFETIFTNWKKPPRAVLEKA